MSTEDTENVVAEEVQEIDPADFVGSELEEFGAAEIEETEFLDALQIESIIESLLFAHDKPLSLNQLRQAFRGTNVNTARIREALENLRSDYADKKRGFSLEAIGGAFQLRTKLDNLTYLRRMVKAKTFRLSGPALEVLSIVAYKQPVIKSEIDSIRGVESGHLLRGLMERHLVSFDGRSDLPGKPMYYSTTRKFLEIFGLRNLKELPSISEIDELLPDGIGEEMEKEGLDSITNRYAEEGPASYSVGEAELAAIGSEIDSVQTSSEFFEQEKILQRERRDSERAQSLREGIVLGETLSEKDAKWLTQYEARIAGVNTSTSVPEAEI